jgi:hypothetical protein
LLDAGIFACTDGSHARKESRSANSRTLTEYVFGYRCSSAEATFAPFWKKGPGNVVRWHSASGYGEESMLVENNASPHLQEPEERRHIRFRYPFKTYTFTALIVHPTLCHSGVQTYIASSQRRSGTSQPWFLLKLDSRTDQAIIKTNITN